MKSNSKLKSGAVLLLLIALFVILNLTGFSKNIRSFFYNSFSSVQKNLWGAGAGVSDFFETIFQLKNIKSENEKLKNENQELSGQLASLLELKKENEILHEALNLGLEKEFRLVLAQVTSKAIGQDVILINKGQKDGLAPGMPVITEQKVLVGKITEVSDRFSKVMLISDKNSTFDAKIIDTKIEGVFKGQGNFKAALDLIPRDSQIKEGDQIVTSALGGVFPSGLLAGKITAVQKNDVGSFQKAEISPIFEVSELDNIFVIVNL